MRWSWKLGRLAGIDLRIHVTFLLLLAWIGTLHYLESRTWQAAALSVLFILAVFFVIVLHELGHALTARRFGIRTFDITLLPIGGIARLERLPERPSQEFLVALAGPAVNLGIALVLLLLLGASRATPDAGQGIGTLPGFLQRLALVNVGLAIFNLIPAFPMDGGRAFRAMLAAFMGHQAATRIAARVGQVMAFIFAGLGIFLNPLLVLIGLFIWITASDEATASRFKADLEGLSAQQAMLTDFLAVAPEDPLSLPVNYLLHSRQHDFPVCREGRILGLLTHQRLLDALARHGEAAPVALAMEAQFEAIAPELPLAEALPKLNLSGTRILPVVRGSELLGLLSLESFAEMWLVQTARHQVRP